MESARTSGTKGSQKPNNVFTIPVKMDQSFFRWWCIFLRPFIDLTNREISVMAEFLRQRWELSKVISDPAVLDTMVMNNNTKKKVMEACGITPENLYVVISGFRKHNIIVDNIINPRLIPNIRKDDNGVFQLLILFNEK